MQQLMHIYIALLITLSSVRCYESSGNHSLNRHKGKSRPKDFLIVDRLNDNEQETRILWNDLAGKETVMLGKQVLENETDR